MEEIISEYKNIIIMITWTIFLLMITCISIFQIRKKHPTAISVMTGIFSIFFCLSFLVGAIAIYNGRFDENGNPRDKIGEMIINLLGLTIDIKMAMITYAFLVIAFIMPQVINYIISGVFGCAKNLFFIRRSIDILFWLIMKSFASASGALSAFYVIALYCNWFAANSKLSITSYSLILLLIMITFSSLLFYYEIKNMETFIRKHIPQSVKALLRKTHNYATKYQRNAPENTSFRKRRQFVRLAATAWWVIERVNHEDETDA
ncbi:hypothetical protein M2352_003221 [Azospirillum fermentarium]|uniref:hypothetical protein n=1 Tax=Azospirillum fermentarium TaxID=1233114 RepID=UPI00222703EA|nr:hypothetical protein [Azospirillum fermentarium]MCW2247587.1 hypothetical protein [Azospirillum fermentarium]